MDLISTVFDHIIITQKLNINNGESKITDKDLS